jgi:chromosome segregation protein
VRLKHLELQGYKTFAARTEFLFDEGITAIVGPNGSGKSNIADAIRWVLGEQSFRALRGKRTEDMIFSGSVQRARLGMASASLLLDNADGWLPIDFAEVTITRRAYRSGENEYLLNGSRVRLRDITELLSKSGLARRTYTVIGQGLVDAVLSLRPEDRRALFEEAAGISLYQSKRADALNRLEETRSNLLRVNDIINEIAPRLRRLEREAERAERYALVSQQMEGLLHTWYGYRWRQEQLNLSRARDAVARRSERLDRRRQALEGLEEQMAAFRARQAQLRDQLGGWHREGSELHGQMEEVQRDLAVWEERARLLALQCEELESELVELEAQGQVAAERVTAAEKELADGKAALEEQDVLVAQAQADLDAHEDRRADLSQQLSDSRVRVLHLTTQTADRRNRLEQLDQRRASLAQEREDHLAAISVLQTRADELRCELASVAAEQGRLQAADKALATEVARIEATLAERQERQADLREALAEAQRSAERLRGRYELLTRLRAEGEGLRAGVRAVLQAARGARPAAGSRNSRIPNPKSPTLSGIIGTVAQLLHVPADYEAAVEVALGGHVQDLVVESWADAEAAISFLRAESRGRATFLPLDTVRAASRLDLAQQWGVVGVAADLVRADEQLHPVVDLLLGRVVVAENLTAARQIFGRLQGEFQIVTLAGEVLRSSGSITGGQAGGPLQGQALAREREWRKLPGQIETAEGQIRRAEANLGESQAAEGKLRDRLALLAEQQQERGEASVKAQAEWRELEREAEQVAQQVTWRQELVARLDEEKGELDAQESSFQADLERLLAERRRIDALASAVQAELEELHGEALYQRLSEARTAAAVARGSWEHSRTALDGLLETQTQLQTQIEAKRQRIADLTEERESLAVQIRAQTTRGSVIRGWLAALAEKIDPAEAEVAHLETEREALEAEEVTLRARLRDAESNHAQALLTQSRQEDRLERIRQQIVDDFGLVEMEPVEGVPEQPPLPLAGLVSELPIVERLPAGLGEEIHHLKAQLRRMGSVNPHAPDEYGEAMDRYSFLTAQAADLEEAASGLREVVAELDEIMHREFQDTFEEVAGRFEGYFTRLFGGGTARLVLTEPQDLSATGIEIVAQPPGRRRQTLALLSGGERSLTAVALIFALLDVSAPPFCILDEVDAMLDEQNVRRFREALEELAKETQFIVITHNRRTIEAADRIYGVSMGNDSVSQVVSLQLEGNRIASADGATVDVVKDG